MSISTNEGRCIGIFVLDRSRPLQNLPKFSFVRHSWIECGRHDETIYECPRHTMTEPKRRRYATECRYTRIRIRQAEDVFVRHAAGRHDIDTAKFRQSIWAPWVVLCGKLAILFCTLSKSDDEEDELEEEEFCTRWPTVLFCFCTGGVVISCPRWATAWSSPEPWAWQEGKLNAPGPLPSMHRLGRAGARVAAGSCSSCWRHAAREAELWLDKVCILQW